MAFDPIRTPRYGPCPVCGELSSKCYACSECGKLLVGDTNSVGRDTAVGG